MEQRILPRTASAGAFLIALLVGCATPTTRDALLSADSGDVESAAAPVATEVASPKSAAPPPPAPPPADLVERVRSDVAKVSVVRNPGSKGWSAVQALCNERLEQAGFKVEKQAFGQTGGVNVIGTKLGKTKPNEHVILSAHYDHVWFCPGADDNGSGVAAAMEVARKLGSQSFDRTLVIAFWDQEEEGLLGSMHYARRAKQKDEKIRIMISLDGIGYTDMRPGSQEVPPGLSSIAPDAEEKLAERGFRGDFIAGIGDIDAEPFTKAFENAAEARGLPSISMALSSVTRLILNDTTRSDHASFWLQGYPAMLVTDTANFRNPRYHCEQGIDSIDTLDYPFLARVTQTLEDLVVGALNAP
jgi:hypothetical protein